MIKETDVTIIIPHLGAHVNQCRALRECLTSLREYTPEIRTIVVKNGEVNCFCEIDIKMLEQGQCRAVNAGVAITNTPWVFITNDDMVYAPFWFDNLQKNITDGYMCISPKLVEPRSGAPTFDVYFCGGAGGDFDKEKWLEYVRNYKIDKDTVCTGFNLPLLIKRELWDTVEGYDIQYDPFGSNSDSDLEYKIRLAGVQPYQNTNCIVYHFSQTSGSFEPKNQAFWNSNWEYFKEKWGFYRTDEGIWEANFHMPTRGEGRIFTPVWEGKYK